MGLCGSPAAGVLTRHTRHIDSAHTSGCSKFFILLLSLSGFGSMLLHGNVKITITTFVELKGIVKNWCLVEVFERKF